MADSHFEPGRSRHSSWMMVCGVSVRLNWFRDNKASWLRTDSI